MDINTILNTAVIYIVIIIGIRLLGKKELGKLSVANLIFIMLISEAVGDVMRATNDTLLGGLVAAVTLMLINNLLNIALFKSKKFNSIMEGNPAIMIRNGQLNTKEMKRNRVTVAELEQAGRENGIGDISEIKLAILEIDGTITILDKNEMKSSIHIDE